MTGRARSLRAAALAALLALAGCADIPSSGPVRVERRVPLGAAPAQPDIRVLPPPPQPGDTPAEIVSGFLQAEGSDAGHHAIARKYLAPGVPWDDTAGAVVYSEVANIVVAGAPGTVSVTGEQVGSLSPHGDYLPAHTALHDAYQLVRVAGQWRLSGVPSGLRLSRRDLLRSYRAEQVYFFDPGFASLVPQTVYVAASQLALPTEVARALLAGPADWLAPAVRTAVPSGTALIGSATVIGGIVALDLGAPAAQVPASLVQPLLAQLAATMGQLPGVSGVRVSAGGQPFALSDHGVSTISTDYAAAYDPDGAAAPPAVEGPVPAGATRRAAADGGRYDSVVLGGRVYTREGTGPWRPRPTARSVTDISYAPGDRLLAAGPGGLELSTAAGPWRPVPGVGPVSAVAAAPDGVRLALVTPAGLETALLVGGDRVVSVRPLAPDLTGASAVAWSGPGSVLALARRGSDPVQLWQISAGGGQLNGITVRPPLPADPGALAAAAGRTTLLYAAGRTWRQEPGAWVREHGASLPAYPD